MQQFFKSKATMEKKQTLISKMVEQSAISAQPFFLYVTG
jgi:hypothetical protein